MDSHAPLVSWLLTVHDGGRHIHSAIESILNQTYRNFIVVIVIESDCKDNTAAICEEYAAKDGRMRIIYNEERLGVAKSLNRGLVLCEGDYIACADIDEVSLPYRLEMQVGYMETHPDVGICGSKREDYNKNGIIIQKLPETHEDICANFLFEQSFWYSSLLIRRKLLENEGLCYPEVLPEVYPFWAKLMDKTKMYNLQQVLIAWHFHSNRVSLAKAAGPFGEFSDNIKATIASTLQIDTGKYSDVHFSFREYPHLTDPELTLDKAADLMREISSANNRLHIYHDASLRRVLDKRWKSCKSAALLDDFLQGVSFDMSAVSLRETVAAAVQMRNAVVNSSPRVIVYGVGQKCTEWFTNFDNLDYERNPFHLLAFCDADRQKQRETFFNRTIIAPENIAALDYDYVLISSPFLAEEMTETLTSRYSVPKNKILSLCTFDDIAAFCNRRGDLEDIDRSYQRNRIPYRKNEKIRIVFLFQIASFWPSWESFYNECIRNEQFEVKLALLNDVAKETVQTLTARKFLMDKGIPFLDFSALDIDEYQPHIIVYQTPYDKWHRSWQNWSQSIKAKGIRIVYIPYGIEIGDTESSRSDNFNNAVITNAWRVFTLSEKMIEEYKKYSLSHSAVRALGLPKFDGLYHNKKEHSLPNDISSRTNGRKICLWKVHFPKRVDAEKKEVQLTPYLEDYLAFAEKLKDYEDLFFIFMPHPKFLEACQWIPGAGAIADNLFETLNKSENVFSFNEDDYRPALVHADYVITDRSALMVEAGALDVPVLYIYNHDFHEPMTQAIAPLIESYYQGTNCADMIRFLDMCRQNVDPKRDERKKAFHECVPYYDGACGKRIAKCMIHDINREANGVGAQNSNE